MQSVTFSRSGSRHFAENTAHDCGIGRAAGQRRVADQRVAPAGARRLVVTVFDDIPLAGSWLREGYDVPQRQDVLRERLGDVREIGLVIRVEIGAAEVHQQRLPCGSRTLLQVDGPSRRAVVEHDGQLSQPVQIASRVGFGGLHHYRVRTRATRRDRHAAVVPIPVEADAPMAGGLDLEYRLCRSALGRTVEDDPLLVERELRGRFIFR